MSSSVVFIIGLLLSNGKVQKVEMPMTDMSACVEQLKTYQGDGSNYLVMCKNKADDSENQSVYTENSISKSWTNPDDNTYPWFIDRGPLKYK